MTVHLHKLHATGNDFLVLIDLEAQWGPRDAPGLAPDDVIALCDRATGVGADGVLRLIAGAGGADVAMELTNADGGRAELTGNGLRCVAWAAAQAKLFDGDACAVDTAAGLRRVDVTRDTDGAVIAAAVDMGAATFDPAAIPVDVPSPFDLEVVVDGRIVTGDAVGIGNPHLVIVVPDVDAVPLAAEGARLEHDPRFPHRTNVEFVHVVDGGLRMRVWERGCGITRSCGTGACAAAAAAHRRDLIPANTFVVVDGGRLDVELGATVRLAGPVVHVFDVDIELAALRAGARPRPADASV